MTDVTKSQITTLRRAAGLLYDFGEMSLAAAVDRFVDTLMGREEEDHQSSQ